MVLYSYIASISTETRAQARCFDQFNKRGCQLLDVAGFDEQRRWARSYWDALAPHHTSVYVNFLMDEGEERVRQAYGDEKYDRLKALKRKYDPTNFFRLNQNIPPD